MPADPLRSAWVEYRSKLHEEGYRLNSSLAQQKLAGAKRDPEETLKYLLKVYDKNAAMAVKNVKDHDSAVEVCQALEVGWKPFLQLSSQLIRAHLPPEERANSKDLMAQLRRRLLPRAEHWKAEAHKRSRRAALALPAAQSDERSRRRDDQGDASLLNGKAQVAIRTAARYAGVSQRRIQQAIREGKLEAVGRKGQRRVTTESLRHYQPPLSAK